MSNIIEVKIPQVGESINEVAIGSVVVNVGDIVKEDQILLDIETEKVSLEVVSPVNGIVKEIFVNPGDIKNIDEVIIVVEKQEISKIQHEQKDVNKPVEKTKETVVEKKQPQQPKPSNSIVNQNVGNVENDGKKIVPMTAMRKKIAKHLVNAQHNGALLTTFNDVDMSQILNIRKKHNDYILKSKGSKLSIVSFFVLAATRAMRNFEIINAQVDGDNIVYNDNINVGVAVSTDNGLVVPVIKDCLNKTLYDINNEIISLSNKARNSKLVPSDMVGGTFSISNGGVFGSMLSTPIVNAPQSAIMGMHSIQKRPIVVDDEIVIREIMYVALSYDHRIIDGKDSVSYLSLVKKYLENPDLLLLDN